MFGIHFFLNDEGIHLHVLSDFKTAVSSAAHAYTVCLLVINSYKLCPRDLSINFCWSSHVNYSFGHVINVPHRRKYILRCWGITWSL